MDLSRFRAYALDQDDVDRARSALARRTNLDPENAERALQSIAEAKTRLQPVDAAKDGLLGRLFRRQR